LDWLVVLKAFGLLLVFEGLLPFLSPEKWRNAMIRIAAMGDRAVRAIALCSMVAGLLLLWWAH